MLQWPGFKSHHYLAFVYLTLVAFISSSNPLRQGKRSVTAPTNYQCVVDNVPVIQAGVTALKYDLLQSRSKRTPDGEAYKPVRIKPFVCNIDIPMQPEEIERVGSIVEGAITVVRRILKVFPVEGALVFSRAPSACSREYISGVNQNKCAAISLAYKGEECLDGYLIPDNHLEGLYVWTETGSQPETVFSEGEGVPEADVVLYAKAEHTSTCDGNGIVAYAAHCKLDQFNRPIAGVINFCPDYLKDDLYDEKKMTLVALHELFHILGFSKSLFEKFQECSVCAEGLKCEERRDVVDESFDQARLHSPAVSLSAQKHWNCSDVNLGVPLENRVGVGFSSHWESRVMHGSLMAPVLSDPHLTFVDEITLSVLEDSGWYKVNYEYADDFPWGKGQGCQFGDTESCVGTSEFFCNNSMSGCHYLHGNTATCTSGEYLDGCSVFKPENKCSASDENLLETSKCFVSNLLLQVLDGESYLFVTNSDNLEPCDLTGQCYLTRCSYNSSQYEIKVGSSNWILCPSGNVTKITGLSGEVHCPPFDLICRNQSSVLDLIDQSTPLSTTTQCQITTQPTEIPTFIMIQFNSLDVLSSYLSAEEAFISSLCQLIPVSRSSIEIIFIHLDQGIFHFTFRNLSLEATINHTNAIQSAVQNQQFILHYQNQSFTAYVFDTYSEPLTFPTPLDESVPAVTTTSFGEAPDVGVFQVMAVLGILIALLVFLIIMLACVLKMVKQQAIVVPSPPLDIEVGVHCRIRSNAAEPRNAYQVDSSSRDSVTACI